jgi:hypothetical protein
MQAVLDEVERKLASAAREADGRMLVARVILTGATLLHRNLQHDSARWLAEVRSRGLELPKLWVADLVLNTRSTLSLSQLAERDDPVGRVFHAVNELRQQPALRQELATALNDLLAKLPPEVLNEARLAGGGSKEVPGPERVAQESAGETPAAAERYPGQMDALIAVTLDDVEQLLLAELSAEDESL